MLVDPITTNFTYSDYPETAQSYLGSTTDLTTLSGPFQISIDTTTYPNATFFFTNNAVGTFTNISLDSTEYVPYGNAYTLTVAA
jgi:hypothetical protein